MNILDLIDRLDVPTLAVLTVYGFWRLTRLLDKMDRHISTRLALIEKDIETVKETAAAHQSADDRDHSAIFDRLNKLGGNNA